MPENKREFSAEKESPQQGFAKIQRTSEEGAESGQEQQIQSQNISDTPGEFEIGHDNSKRLDDVASDEHGDSILPVEEDENILPTLPTTKNRQVAIDLLFMNVDKLDRNIRKKAIHDACKAFGSRGVRHDNGKWLVKGMQSGLYLYQLMGAAWLRNRENGDELPRGGILADYMGFGKTIQMISNIVNDRWNGEKGSQERKEAKRRITLVVVPNVALADQWNEEIKRHCSAETPIVDKVLQLHSSARLASSNVLQSLQKFRVIITTYAEVSSQFHDGLLDSFPDEDAKKKWIKDNARKIGPFFKTDFHRIVLDEGHRIKNRTSKVSRACRELKGECNWVLTGTPVQNSSEELYPYLHFLKVPEITTFRDFNKFILQYSVDSETPILDEIMKKILLRRTHKHTILGKKIVEIPEDQQRTTKIHFNRMERKLYNQFAEDTRQKVDEIVGSSKGKLTVADKLKILTQAMNLRLLTAHPFLVAHMIARPAKTDQPEHGFSNQDMVELLQLADRQRPLSDPEVEAMRECIQNFAKDYATQVSDYARRSLPSFTKAQLRVIRKKTIGKGTFKYRTDIWVNEKGFPIVVSSKLQKAIDQVKEWLQDDPNRKIVIFTQFIEVIKILKHALKTAGIGCEMYHGGMTNIDRAEAKDKFETIEETKVLIMSLMAGGTGLNLTCASRMINIDLWWNKAQEEQAFGRVCRLGQASKTELVRFAVRGTIDERLLKIQKKKSKAISAIFDGKIELAAKALSAEDAIYLARGDFDSQDVLFYSEDHLDDGEFEEVLAGGCNEPDDEDIDGDSEEEGDSNPGEDDSDLEDDENSSDDEENGENENMGMEG